MTKRVLPVIAAALITLAVAACGSSSGGKGSISLVAYSTPKEAYADLIPAFQKTAVGKGVKFTQSYGASGDQSRAVDSGLHADVVAFSLEPDVTRLVKDGIVDASWNANAHKGMVTDSVVVFAVRKGNPKHLRTWQDLAKPGVGVIEPNPFTSGGARWNVMAAYGSQIAQGRTDKQAEAYLGALFKNVVVQDKSARDALQTFAGGKGDVLIAYENEAITAQQKGEKVDYVIPDQTILIENPIAVVKKTSHAPAANAFVRFLHTAPAQKIFAAKGYRPVLASALDASKFPTPPQLFEIGDLGGWSVVAKKFFDPDKGLVADIERSLGVPTAK